MVKLGQEVRDKVTGFTGTAAAEVEYLYGCNQIGVSPKMSDSGDVKDAEFFDIGRLEYVGDGISAEGGTPNWPDKVKLGNEIKDKITGFTGIATGRVRYLFGNVSYGIVPKVNDNGEMKSIQYFDSGRVEVIGRGIAPEEVQVEKKGGISRDMPRGIR